MRILLVSSTFPPYGGGGVTSHVIDLAKGLVRAGNDVVILSCRGGKPPKRNEGRAAPDGSRVVFSHDYWAMFRDIGPLVRRGRFDVIHLHSFNALALGLFVRGGPWSMVFTFHADTARFFASVHGWRSRYHPEFLALKTFQRLANNVADLVIAVSRSAQAEAESYGIKRVVHIPNAVDTDEWTPPTGSRPNGSHSILLPRMHVPKNGIEVAIESVPRILEAIPDAELVITGDGPLRPKLERMAEGLPGDRIRFVGMVGRKRLRELYAETAVVVIPSVDSAGMQEPFGIAALEAMASGKPVIVSDVGGLPEVVRNGVDGYVVPQKDPQALADATIRVLQDPGLAARLAREGRERAVQLYSVESWTRQVLQAYALAAQYHGGKRSEGG